MKEKASGIGLLTTFLIVVLFLHYIDSGPFRDDSGNLGSSVFDQRRKSVEVMRDASGKPLNLLIITRCLTIIEGDVLTLTYGRYFKLKPSGMSAGPLVGFFQFFDLKSSDPLWRVRFEMTAPPLQFFSHYLKLNDADPSHYLLNSMLECQRRFSADLPKILRQVFETEPLPGKPEGLEGNFSIPQEKITSIEVSELMEQSLGIKDKNPSGEPAKGDQTSQ